MIVFMALHAYIKKGLNIGCAFDMLLVELRRGAGRKGPLGLLSA